MMQYELMEGTDTYSLQSAVNNKLTQGWDVFGSPIIEKVDYGVKFYQAVVKTA